MSTNYDVEEILESRKKGNKVEYLVRWAPSWEAEKNLNCAKLLREFKQKSGETDNKNGENDDQNDETDEEKPSPAKRGAPRKAATAANKKRKATQKKTIKRRRR